MISGGLCPRGGSVVTWDLLMPDHVLDLERVAEASAAIPEVFLSTPQYRSEGLSRLLGLDVLLKVETVNPVGSAAGRGVEWWFERHPEARRIVCPSTGDFGEAMAYAGRVRGVEVGLFGPLSTDRLKVDDLRRGGTTVQLDGRDRAEAAVEARRYASVVDAEFIDGGADLEFLEGSATLAAELGEEAADTGAIFVPADTEFLPVGVGQWLHQRAPRTRVVAVTVGTGPTTVGAGDSSIDQRVHVQPDAIRDAQRALSRHEGLRVSAVGAAPLAAAALAGPPVRGMKVIVVVGSRGLD